MKTKFRLLFIASSLLLLASLNAQFSTLLAQGALTPPGAPGPTMKSLDQVEARTPIDATHTPGDGANQFIISAPGSYYLTGNITGVSGLNGITINTNNVSLDLNGFAMMGVPGSGDGILVSAAVWNLRLRNGSVQSWGGRGIDCSQAANSEFDHLRISHSLAGIYCGVGSSINNCSAETNVDIGIDTGNQSTVSGCTEANNGDIGLSTGFYCTVTASTSVGNSVGLEIEGDSTITGCTASANNGTGFDVGDDCTIKDCTASVNNGEGIYAFDACTIKDCSATGNSGFVGISVEDRSSITGCTACNNAESYGIYFDSECFVSGNNANGNANGNSYGIVSGGSVNRIDGNCANRNTYDGFVWGNDYLVRNTAFLNGAANYNPVPGTGNSGPINAASSSTNPWANF